MASFQRTFSSQLICRTPFRLLIETNGFCFLFTKAVLLDVEWPVSFQSQGLLFFVALTAHAVLDQTSYCCPLMSSCCSFTLTPNLNTERMENNIWFRSVKLANRNDGKKSWPSSERARLYAVQNQWTFRWVARWIVQGICVLQYPSKLISFTEITETNSIIAAVS